MGGRDAVVNGIGGMQGCDFVFSGGSRIHVGGRRDQIYCDLDASHSAGVSVFWEKSTGEGGGRDECGLRGK